MPDLYPLSERAFGRLTEGYFLTCMLLGSLVRLIDLLSGS